MEQIGIRKVWHSEKGEMDDFVTLVRTPGEYHGLKLNWHNFNLQILNCFIINIISLQKEIFWSHGYEKFITQKDGSMDLLVQLSAMKGHAITMIQNNARIQKIIAIKKRREIIQ